MAQTSVHSPLARRCITYGTFDLLHDGHRRLLRTAREFGSYLIVAVVTDGFNAARGKYNIRQSTMERVAAIQQSGLADEIILEDCDAKINDILKYQIDVCVVGSDWAGSSQYREHIQRYCELVVVERTANISSTLLRGNIKIGCIGSAFDILKLVRDAGDISGVVISAILQTDHTSITLDDGDDIAIFSTNSIKDFFVAVDAVYISTAGMFATPHHVKEALKNGKHVMYEPPLASRVAEADVLRGIAMEKHLTLLETSPIAYLPALERLIAVAQNGKIGRICLVSVNYMEQKQHISVPASALARTPLLPVVKLLGLGDISLVEQKHVLHVHVSDPILTRVDLSFSGALSTIHIGKGTVLHEDLVIAGTKGYVYVAAPWWQMTSFEVRLTEPNFEDSNTKQTFQVPTRDGGYRYDIAEFARAINAHSADSHRFSRHDACTIDRCVETLEEGLLQS